MRHNLLVFLRLFRESYHFAFHAIIANKLRTLLSLLGITIGIFAIISVFTVFDSIESTIRKNIESLGNNVVFIEKWAWSFGGDYEWWKYWQRPIPTIDELQEIQKRSTTAEAAAFLLTVNKTVFYFDNSIEDVAIVATSHDYEKVMTFEIKEGRYFSPTESTSGKNVAIIGSDIATNLFEEKDPIGKFIKVFGQKLEVIGVLKKEGEGGIIQSSDNYVLIPINFGRNYIDMRARHLDAQLIVKGKENVSVDQLKDELTGIMRSIRKLKPAAEDNFSINEIDLLTKSFESLFRIIAIVGWIIGGFSLLVGGFGIANIMFVSVKERTHIIGIQKSLGAKNYFILLEYIFEAILLSLVGGALGLLIVFIGTLIVSSFFDISLGLTQGNIILGLGVSFVIGFISGLAPAYFASRLNPVEAIRSSN